MYILCGVYLNVYIFFSYEFFNYSSMKYDQGFEWDIDLNRIVFCIYHSNDSIYVYYMQTIFLRYKVEKYKTTSSESHSTEFITVNGRAMITMNTLSLSVMT